ncbi:peptidylprolyl isomerase [Sulfurimonas sp. MAG313]|nr:peptidylprolyl isomerase [Sulfurimonas sp. MAG313]MDF1879862.1 peptidylprolyl isomerase [Sulfurimonas sp. MAG313]
MAIAENQIVSIEYEVKSNGEVVDSNVGGDLLTFMVGKQQIIPGLEEQVCTMDAGEKADVLVPAVKAYGTYNDDALQEVPKEQFAGIELTEGMSLYGQNEDGGTVQVTVKEIKDENVMIDYNHPLAGKDLMFTVSISTIREATASEIETGIPAENAAPESGGSCGTGCGCH